MRAGGLVLTLALGALLLASTAAVSAQATDAFVAEGQVVNGTGGAEPPAELQVRIIALSEGRTLGAWEAATDAQGRYRAESVARMAGATYIVGTEYGGVSYVDRFDPGDGTAAVVPPLSVFESVAEDPGIRFERSAWIVSLVDAARQTISMLEVHSLSNPTDRTFRPRPDGAGGPSGLLVFALPAHAFGLTPQLGLDASGIVQIDRGFASLEPVRPGRTEVAFSYQFPYAEISYPLRRTVRYPLESLRVLAPADGPTLRADGFELLEGAMVGDRQYRELRSGALAPGTVVTVTLDGLPARAALAAPIPPAAIGIGGAIAGVAAVLVAWWRARKNRLVSPTDDELVDQLVVLEMDRSAGRIDSDAYEDERARLLARVADGRWVGLTTGKGGRT